MGPLIPEIDKNFQQLLDMDLRIVMSSDDFHRSNFIVMEPSRELISQDHVHSKSGALTNSQFAQLGFEIYMHKKAPKGVYTVMSNGHSNDISGASSVSVTFYRNWGRPNQKSKIVTMRLDSANVNQEIGNYRLE